MVRVLILQLWLKSSQNSRRLTQLWRTGSCKCRFFSTGWLTLSCIAIQIRALTTPCWLGSKHRSRGSPTSRLRWSTESGYSAQRTSFQPRLTLNWSFSRRRGSKRSSVPVGSRRVSTSRLLTSLKSTWSSSESWRQRPLRSWEPLRRWRGSMGLLITSCKIRKNRTMLAKIGPCLMIVLLMWNLLPREILLARDHSLQQCRFHVFWSISIHQCPASKEWETRQPRLSLSQRRECSSRTTKNWKWRATTHHPPVTSYRLCHHQWQRSHHHDHRRNSALPESSKDFD